MSGRERRTANRTAALWSGLLAAAAALPVPLSGQPMPEPTLSMSAPPRLLFEDVRTVDWAPRGDWIAFDRTNSDGFSQLHVARPDGSGERCLTCDIWDLRHRHCGSPTWHPSGKHLVFVVEKPVKSDGAPLPLLSVPGGNLGMDLWAVSFDGKTAFNITNRTERGGRVLAPRFSHEGDQLVWSERQASGGGAFGQWSVQVARFSAGRGVPRIRGAKTYRPGAQQRFIETYGFTPDDRGVLFAANLDPGQPEGALDLYVLRLEGGEIRRLTATRALDRFARLTPDGRWLVWASSLSQRDDEPIFERREKSTDVALDLWLMDSEGRQARRLTRFNDATSNEYFGRVMTGTVAWSRDGRQLLVPLISLGSGGGSGLYLLELAEAGW